MVREDLCATLHERYDRMYNKKKTEVVQRITAKKPTCLIIHGINIERYMQDGVRRCKKEACPMVYAGTRIHKKIIMSKSKKVKASQAHKLDQAKLPEEEKEVLSIGMFSGIWKEHEQWRKEKESGDGEYYCSVCANLHPEEYSDVKICTEVGCNRVQHEECSTDRRSDNWKCETCLKREILRLPITTGGIFSRMQELTSWLNDGLIDWNMYEKIRDELR